jgi:hypothetical protein
MKLSKPQRNEIFRAVEKRGLSPHEFGWDGESTFRHRASGAYLEIGGGPGAYTTRRQAGDLPVEERTELSRYRLIKQVELWLGDLVADIETPDLWAQLEDEAAFLGGVSSDETFENTPFTPAEQEEIKGQLRELSNQVRSRVGRKDWFLLGVALMLGYVLTAALPPDTGRDIFQTVIENIGHVWGPPEGPLGLPGG